MRRRASAVRRIRALGRAEMLLLIRNRTAMFTALGLPAVTVAFLQAIGVGERSEIPVAALTFTTLVGFVVLYVVYYNLVTAYVARREELVFKRLRVGEATDVEILTGTALPSLAIALVQVVVVGAGTAVVLGLDRPVNALLVVVAFVGGSAVFVLLAAASTAFTRNVETAQVSTLPVLVVCMMLSGMLVPVASMPDVLAVVVRFLPLTPVVDLSRLGLTGLTGDGSSVGFADSFAEAAFPVAVLAGWIVVGCWAVRRWFRWEPRT